MLKATINFSGAELSALMQKAVRSWNIVTTNSKIDINVDEKTRLASAYLYLPKDGGSAAIVTLEHEVIVAGITEAAATEGNLIDPASLVFTYHPGRGFGGGPSVSATANPSSTQPTIIETLPGKIQFPGFVSVHFGEDALKALLVSATKRSGQTPGYITTYFTSEKGISVNISVVLKGSASASIKLEGIQVDEALTEEFTAQGYSVVPDTFKYSQSTGGFGSSSSTSLNVKFTTLPSKLK